MGSDPGRRTPTSHVELHGYPRQTVLVPDLQAIHATACEVTLMSLRYRETSLRPESAGQSNGSDRSAEVSAPARVPARMSSLQRSLITTPVHCRIITQRTIVLLHIQTLCSPSSTRSGLSSFSAWGRAGNITSRHSRTPFGEPGRLAIRVR